MMSEPKRPLLKGSLRPPKVNPSNLSYTQPPASRDDLSIGAQGKNVKGLLGQSSNVVKYYLHDHTPYFLLQWWNSTLRQYLNHSLIRLSSRRGLRWIRNGSLGKRTLLELQETKQRARLQEIEEPDRLLTECEAQRHI
jgi:hypothetical protein